MVALWYKILFGNVTVSKLNMEYGKYRLVSIEIILLIVKILSIRFLNK